MDYTELNKEVKRERHILQSVDHILGQLSGAILFSKLDANCGFHQIKISEQSQPLSTFITPFGRYCYKRLPTGVSSGPEHYQRQIHYILEGLTGVVCLMDDIVVFGSTEEHNSRLHRVLTKLADAGVTLNKAKCSFKQKENKFLGHVIGNGALKADNDKLRAVVEMLEPSNINELRRFFGMVNHLAKFLPDLATVTAPLHPLLARMHGHGKQSIQPPMLK